MVFTWSPYVVATLPPLTRAPYVVATLPPSTGASGIPLTGSNNKSSNHRSSNGASGELST